MRDVLIVIVALLATSVHAYKVVAPVSLQGVYRHCSAQDGLGDMAGTYNYVSPLITASPFDGCNPLVAPVNVSYAGKAVMLMRGGCTFEQVRCHGGHPTVCVCGWVGGFVSVSVSVSVSVCEGVSVSVFCFSFYVCLYES
jgi:hypothetical protein